MRRTLAPAVAFAFALLLAGCLRVGPGDDLHLVCEEKSGSPRKAYDVGFLVAQTRVEGGTITDKELVAMLEAARAHVITLGGRPHTGFSANLTPAADDWRFLALGEREGAAPDIYDVLLIRKNGAWTAPPPIRAPASVQTPAWNATNATPSARAALGDPDAPPTATWDPALPACVTFEAKGGRVVTNAHQRRVVFIDAP